MNKTSVLSAALFACAMLPAGAGTEQAPHPQTAAGFAQLEFFTGDWSCTGKSFASSAVPAPVTTATLHAGQAVAGHWIALHYDESESAGNPTPYHSGQYLGYDAVTQKFMAIGVDDTDAYSTETGSGWNGDTMTFEGTMITGGRSAGLREVFTRKSPDEMEHSAWARGADGQWVETDQETCHKAG